MLAGPWLSLEVSQVIDLRCGCGRRPYAGEVIEAVIHDPRQPIVELIVDHHLLIFFKLIRYHWVAAQSSDRVLIEYVLPGLLRNALLALILMHLAARLLTDQSLVHQQLVRLHLMKQFLSFAPGPGHDPRCRL